MFLDWKNQYGKNDYTNQSNLQIQWNPYQITKGIFHRTRQKPLQFAWKHKRPQTVKTILRKKKGKLEKSTFLTPDYTTKLQSTREYGTGTHTHKTRYRPMEQDKNPRDKPMHLWTLHFDKGGENIQWRRDNLFNKWCQKNWTATCERMKLEHFLTICIKINSNGIKDLNVRPEIINSYRKT